MNQDDLKRYAAPSRAQRAEVVLADGRRFAIAINRAGEVSSLHQIFARSVLVGGEFTAVWDDYRSIARNHKKRPVLEFKVLAKLKEPA